jgi:hypothetical protein
MSALELIRIAKSAATGISLATIETRNAVLRELASSLRLRSAEILTANGLDLQAAVSGGMELGLQDRLRLDEKRIESLARAVEEIIQLDDPLGETVMAKTLPNGIQIRQVRVPFGLIGMIYEARPNVNNASFLFYYDIAAGNLHALHVNGVDPLVWPDVFVSLFPPGIVPVSIRFNEVSNQVAVVSSTGEVAFVKFDRATGSFDPPTSIIRTYYMPIISTYNLREIENTSVVGSR